MTHVHWVVKKNGCYLTMAAWLSLGSRVAPHFDFDRWITKKENPSEKDNVFFDTQVMTFTALRTAKAVAKVFDGKAFRITRKTRPRLPLSVPMPSLA